MQHALACIGIKCMYFSKIIKVIVLEFCSLFLTDKNCLHFCYVKQSFSTKDFSVLIFICFVH